MAITQKMDNTKYWQRCGEIGILIILLVGIENGTDTLESSLAAAQNVKHRLAIVTQQFYSRYLVKRTDNIVHTKTYTQVFIAAVCVIAKR